MKHRIEKPITKIVSAVLTALLVFNLIPVGSFSVRAEGEEPLVSTSYTLVYQDANHETIDIQVDGSFELTNIANPNETFSGPVSGGRFEVSGFTDGAAYSLNLTLNGGTNWFCDTVNNRFFGMPGLPMNVTLHNALSGTIICTRIGEDQYSGSVRNTEGHPVGDATVTVSSIGAYTLSSPLTTKTNPQGQYTISLPNLPGQSIGMQIKKEGHYSVSINAIPAETKDFGESTLHNIKPDRTKPVISLPQTEDRFNYYDASGLGRAGVTQARLLFADGTPDDPYEEVSGLKALYIIDEALGTFEDVKQKTSDPIVLNGEASYTYIFNVTPGKVYTIYAEDMRGHHSEAYTVTYQNDDKAPIYWNVGLYTDKQTHDQTGIAEKTDGYHSPQTVYFCFETGDTGSNVNSGVDHTEVYVKSKTTEEYELYASVAPDEANICSIELTGSTFADYRKLGVVIYDKAGNGTGLLTLTDMGLKKDSVAIGNMAPVITEAVEGTSVSPLEGAPGSVFKDPPKFTFTFTDPEEFGLKDITIEVNGTVWTPETGKELLTESTLYESGTQIILCDPKDADGNRLLQNGQNNIVVSCTSLSGTASKSYQYILDQSAPVISKITVEPYSDGTTLGITNGVIYSNGPVKVAVEASDGAAFAGLSSVTLFNNGSAYMTETIAEGNAAVFVIPTDYEESAEYKLNISVKASDTLGNETSETILTDSNSNTGTGIIFISSSKTEISLSVTDGTAIGEATWYTVPPELSVSVKDDFGITKIYISVNGAEIEGSPFTFTDEPLLTERSLKAQFDASMAGESGICHIIVTVENSAGILTNTLKDFYLDGSAPNVCDFELDAAEGYSLKLTEHGNYATGPIEVTVTAQDDRVGIEKIVLLADGTVIAEQTPDEGGAAVFTVAPEQFSSEVVRHTVSAYAVDRLGNTGEPKAIIPNENTNLESADIVFDTTAPTVTAEPEEGTPEGRTTGEGETQKVWYSSDVVWNISLNDSESGLATYTVTLNGTDITTDADGNELIKDLSDSGQVDSKSFRISTAQITANEDCSYELVVSATNNAGIASEVCRQVVNIDSTAPEITEIKFYQYNPGQIISNKSYALITNGPVLITVYAKDCEPGPVSGVEKIQLFLNGELFGEAPINPESGRAEFLIPGEELSDDAYLTYIISVKAVDASGLCSEEKKLSEVRSDAENGNDTLIIERIPPVIDLRFSEQGQIGVDSEDQIWYADDFEFYIRGTDQAALSNFVVKINGEIAYRDANGAELNNLQDLSLNPQPVTDTGEFRFRSEDYANEDDDNEDDTFVIEISCVDLAGNHTYVKKIVRIDRKAPVITGFALKSVAEADSLNYLRFGTFANGKVEVTVFVSDEEPSAGAGKVMLYLHEGSQEYLLADVVDGKAVFVIPESDLVSGVDNEYTFSAVPVDAAGNVGAARSLDSQVIPEMTVELIRIETIAPVVTAVKDGAPGKTANGTQWCLADVIWNVSVSDEQSGIATVSVTLNGKQISEDVDGQAIEANYGNGDEPVKALKLAISSSQVTVADDNSVTIEVTATDNAGNVSTLYKDTIYKDSTAPVIKGFTFRQQGGAETGVLSPGSSLSESGYVFSKDTVVRIIAEDPNQGSGIMRVSYYLKNPDGTESEVHTASADANGEIFITIKAPFKGEIYAKAYDQLSNVGDYVGVKGVIIESSENHNTETHITLTKPQATGVQSNGTELYNANVELNLRIADHYSGIKTVEWSVTAPYDQARNQAGTLTVSDNGALNGDGGWTVVSTDGKMVTELTKAIVVSNDSNDITVRIRMRDSAGNVSERQMTFGIDKTVPTVEYSFDNTTPDSDYGNIYNQSRTMTIVVTERNFVPGDFTFSARNTDGSAPAIGRWTEETDPNDPNKTIHTTTVSFFSDGNYSIGLSYSDRAGNRAGIAAVPSFIIDRTRPIINVSFDNNDAKNGNYYNTERTATVTVVERNFDVSRVQLDGNAQKTGIWTANGDQHSITLTFSKDGSYSFTVSASDRAGNTTEAYTSETFIIDTTAPKLTLEGFDRANGGEVAPIITCMDDNFDPAGVNINLTRISNKEVHVRYTTSEIEDEERTGMRWTYANIDPEQENDDLYTFRISATDKAGNACETIIKSFSVNRYGSTYDLNSIENLNGKYSSVTEDLVIYEYNVDEIDTDEVTVELLRNNEHRNLVRGKDYAVETVIEKDQEFNKYKYVIRKEVFAQDGEYSIQIVSQDKAGNVNQNTEKGAESRIAFCIDKIEPDIIVIEPVSGGSYAQPSLTATVLIRDNYKLDKVHFILDGVELQANLSGDTFTIEIPESDSKQTLEIYATDAAGNVARTEIKDILVTSSMLIRFIHNTAALVTTIILLLLLLALAVFMVIHRRRSKA